MSTTVQIHISTLNYLMGRGLSAVVVSRWSYIRRFIH